MASIPGVVNAGTMLAMALLRRGRYDEARTVLDEVVPLARGLGGTEFLSLTLRLEAELEEARGNLAAGRQSLDEALALATESPEYYHLCSMLDLVARLLPVERAVELVDRVRPYARDPGWMATVLEADAVLRKDRAQFAEAAERYRALELPYQEARCRIEAGELDRAVEIVHALGLERGPLGARLRQLGAGP
jgi:tetratricopeptide (TPR) repeat protein